MKARLGALAHGRQLPPGLPASALIRAPLLEEFAVLAGRERYAERAIRLLGAGEAF